MLKYESMHLCHYFDPPHMLMCEHMIKQPVCNDANKASLAGEVNIVNSQHFTSQ